MELINALGINIGVLISQLISFGVLFFVLYKLSYKPMLEFLDKRNKDIGDGIINAQKANDRLVELGQMEKDIIKQTRIEAAVILEEAKERAEKKYDEIVKKAKEEVGQIINQEKEKIRMEKAEALKDIKRKISDLVMMVLEKVLEDGVNEKRDKILIKETVKKLS